MKKHTAKSIYSIIKERILSLEYLPDHRFTEKQLCEEFTVSRIPVREALRMLIDAGLVTKIPHVGCRVRRLTLEDIDHLYELRLALELFAVEALASMPDAAERVKDLRSEWEIYCCIDRNEEIIPRFWADADERFHETLVEQLENPVFSDALRDINEKIRFLRLRDITSHERLARTCDKHLQILDAVVQNDISISRRGLYENIMMGKANVQESFKTALMSADE